MANGSWSVQLSPQLPSELKDVLAAGFFGHIAIATGRQDPRVAGDSLLTSARYVGVVNAATFKTASGPVVSGEGMSLWLASSAGVGDVLETPLSFTAAGAGTVVAALLPSSVHSGTIHSIGAATYTGAFVWKNRRDALTSFCQQVSTGPGPTQAVEWRVNGNATLDFGHVSELYVTTPTTAIVARDAGVDMALRGLPGTTQLAEDVKDFTSRLVVLAEGGGASTAVGVANLADIGSTNPYVDLFGAAVKMTRMVSASSVSSLNASASAQIALAPYAVPRDQLQLSSSEYDILGELAVGDYTYVWDPDAGMVDTTHEIVFRGQRLNPAALRVIEQTWPIVPGMTVAFRSPVGTWYDLTDYVLWDSGETTVVVGGYNRALVSTSEPVGPRPIPDTTIPGVPVFGAFTTTAYQSPADGKTKSQIQLSWSTPANTDGTTITDGGHYEIQYRPNIGYYATNPSHAQIAAAGYTLNTLAGLGGTHNALIPAPIAQWKPTFVGWGTNTLLVQELTPGVVYDFQIRAVDTAAPPNNGAWSATTDFTAAADTIPPPTPDAPTVAANMAAVQVTWDCGTSDGGTFNQASDLHHIEVHGSYEPLFTPSSTTKLGSLPANAGNITGQIPVVGSFTIPPGQPPAQAMFVKIVAVDISGNKSAPSAAAGATATLWSNSYITDLSVSKLTAGTITASIILGGTIATAANGQRVQMDSTGVHSYDASGNVVFDLNTNSTSITLSQVAGGEKIVLSTPPNSYPVMLFYDATDNNAAFINAVNLDGNTAGLGMNSGQYAVSGTTYVNRITLLGNSGCTMEVVDTNQAERGGFYHATIGNARWGVSNPTTELGAYNIDSAGLHTAYGTWDESGAGTNYDAVIPSVTNVSAGFSALTVSLPTLLTQPSPICTVYDSHATNTFATVTSILTTSVTITYPNANSVRVMSWMFRT
jgi:hypothetical protein